MKTIFSILVGGFLSFSAMADVPVKNEAYANQAKAAAKAIYDLNWGPSRPKQFEVIKETYEENELNIFGAYKVQVFTIKGRKRIDCGIDIDVTIIDNAVLEVKVDCRICG